MNDQQQKALATANRNRSARASLKRWLASDRSLDESKRKLASVVLTTPMCARSMRVADLLKAGWRMNTVTAKRLLALARISETMQVGGLTERQRQVLSGLLLSSLHATKPPSD